MPSRTGTGLERSVGKCEEPVTKNTSSPAPFVRNAQSGPSGDMAAGGRLGDGLSFWELKYSTVDYTTLNILKSIDLYTLSR